MRGYMDSAACSATSSSHRSRPRILRRAVVGEIQFSCWQCETCISVRPTHCPNRTTTRPRTVTMRLRELIAVPQRNLHRVPRSVPTDAAVFHRTARRRLSDSRPVAGEPPDRCRAGRWPLGHLCAQVLAVSLRSRHSLGNTQEAALLDALGIETRCSRSRWRRAGVSTGLTWSSIAPARNRLPTVRSNRPPRGTIVLKTTMAGSQQMRGRLSSSTRLRSSVHAAAPSPAAGGARCRPYQRAAADFRRFDLSRVSSA